MSNTIIESLGVFLPPREVSTEEVLAGCKEKIRFPLQRLTGIKTRRMAGEDIFALDLARNAVSDCFSHSKYTAQDIDLVLCCNISRCAGDDYNFTFEPGTATRLVREFGLNNALAFDISNACAGFFTGIQIADSYLRYGTADRILVVSGEYITHLTTAAQQEIESYMDPRMACLTLGDSGVAMILEKSSSPDVGFHELNIHTWGKYYEYCIAKASDKAPGRAIMVTDAIRTTSVAMQGVPHAVNTIRRAGWSPEMINHLIVHQTSALSINDARREINQLFRREVCTEQNTVNNLKERGNTSTTTHFVAIRDLIDNKQLASGDKVVFGITGSGMNIGTALYTFDDLPDRVRANGEASKEQTPLEIDSAGLKPHFDLPRVRVESVGLLPDDWPAPPKTIEMCQAAAEACIARSRYSKDEINLLLFSGTYRTDNLVEPAIASIIAGELDINAEMDTPAERRTFCFDVFNSANATLNACFTAIQFLKSGKAKTGFLVASEVENNLASENAELSGLPLAHLKETSSAMMLDLAAEGKEGFGNFAFKTFPEHVEAMTSRTLLVEDHNTMLIHRDKRLRDIFLQCIPEVVGRLLAIEGINPSEIAVVLPPQMPGLIEPLSRAIEIPQDQFIDLQPEVDYFTSSLPYSLQAAKERETVKTGDIGLIISVGAGLQVGCATYYF